MFQAVVWWGDWEKGSEALGTEPSPGPPAPGVLGHGGALLGNRGLWERRRAGQGWHTAYLPDPPEGVYLGPFTVTETPGQAL